MPPENITLLARLCRYYLDCLSHEDLGGVSVPACPNNGVLEYAEFEASPFVGDTSALRSTAVQGFLNELQQDMNRKALFLGYPVHLKQTHAPGGGNGFKIEPLFLFSFQDQYAEQGNISLSVDAPQINFDALKSMLNPQNTSLFQEAACGT